MVDQNELGNLGAIQATDIIGEELKRAAVQLSLKRSARSISRRMQTLGCWAIERRAANNGAASSPDISSPEAEPKASAATQYSEKEFSEIRESFKFFKNKLED